jgi:hypothetical protein
MIRAALPALLLLLGGAARAQPASQPAPQPAAALEDTAAFEHGFAVSLYQFDACGDPLAGRMFRQALAERFARCPYTAAARERFARRSRAEEAKVRRTLAELVEREGGLPRQMAGMTESCHAQQASPAYRAFRGRLEAYALGAAPAEAILPAACDARDILP